MYKNKSLLLLLLLGNLPVERAKDAVCFLQWCGLRLLSVVSSAIIYNIVSEKVTRWPIDLLTRRPVDLFEKEPLKGNS